MAPQWTQNGSYMAHKRLKMALRRLRMTLYRLKMALIRLKMAVKKLKMTCIKIKGAHGRLTNFQSTQLPILVAP